MSRTLRLPVPTPEAPVAAPFSSAVLRIATALSRWGVVLRAEPDALVLTGAEGLVYDLERRRVEVSEILWAARELHRLVRRLEATEVAGSS